MQPGSATAVASLYGARRRVVALAVLAMVLALDILDGTIVNIAVPSIQRSLGADYATIQWLIAGYSLAFALLLVTGGRLGDVVGYRRMFVLGVAGFTLASLACGLAWSPQSLIAARIAQGAMAALMAPQGMALTQIMYRPHERTVVMGVFGVVGGLSAVLGPILGGVLIQADLFGLGWRPIFLINLPLGLLAVLAGLRLLPAGRSAHAMKPDGGGTLLLVAALFLIVFPLVQGREYGWPLWTFAMLAAAVPALYGFARYVLWKSRRDGSALVAPELFTERSFVVGLTLNLVFQMAAGGYLLTYTLLMQLGLGYSPIKTALTSIPFAAAVGFAISFVSRKVARRLGRYLLTLGAGVMALGLTGLAISVGLAAHSLGEPWVLLPSLLVAGLGMGMVIGPLSTIVLSRVDVRHAGSASGVLSSVQQLGSAIGVAVGGAVFFGTLGVVDAAVGFATVARFARAFQASVGLDIALLVVVAALSLRLPDDRVFARPD